MIIISVDTNVSYKQLHMFMHKRSRTQC